jgi:hypothetical protein
MFRDDAFAVSAPAQVRSSTRSQFPLHTFAIRRSP